jgi:hypothetical protein
VVGGGKCEKRRFTPGEFEHRRTAHTENVAQVSHHRQSPAALSPLGGPRPAGMSWRGG